jgi:hypothetical protein
LKNDYFKPKERHVHILPLSFALPTLFFLDTMAEQGPIALPTDSSTGNWWSDLQQWFNTKLDGERTPLLGDDAAAARKRRRYNIKIAITSILVLIASIVVIVFAVDWFKSGDEGNRKGRTFFELVCNLRLKKTSFP